MQRPNEEFGGWFWTNLRIYTPWKAVAAVLICALGVVGCGREASISRTLDTIQYADLDKATGDPHRAKQAHILAQSANELTSLLRQQESRDLSDRGAARGRALRSIIGEQLDVIDARLKADRRRLTELSATAAIKRLDAVARSLHRKRGFFDATIAAVPSNGRVASSHARSARRALESLLPPATEDATSSDFSFRAADSTGEQPTLSASVVPAYGAPAPGAIASQLPKEPETADTTTADETLVSPALDALIARLGRDPVRIFNYVRNEIRFEPYSGIRKGATETLAERGGSAADQSALLISLLRGAGVPARYVSGTVEISAATAASWMGIDSSRGETMEAAADQLAAGGVPVTQIRADGRLVKLRFEHTWAEAYVPVAAYRGVDEGRGGASRWIALDPSVKPHKVVHSDAPPASVRSEIDTLVSRFIEASDVQADGGFIAPSSTEVAGLVNDTTTAITSKIAGRGITNSNVADRMTAETRIQQSELSVLPASTPFVTRSIENEYRQAPLARQARVSIAVSGSDPDGPPSADEQEQRPLTFEAPTASLAGKRITIGYAPATAKDAEVIAAYGGLFAGTPAYAAALVPVLRVNGDVVARGTTPVPTAYQQRLRITYRSPGFSPDVVDNQIVAGALEALILDLGTTTVDHAQSRLTALKQLAPTTSYENMLTDERIGELLSYAGTLYFLANDLNNGAVADDLGIRAHRALSGALVGTETKVTSVAGFPIAAGLGGATVDVDQDVQSVTSLTGDPRTQTAYLRATATLASISESQVLKNVIYDRTVSTAEILGQAAKQRMPIYHVTADNWPAVADRLDVSDSVRARITTEVAAGSTVDIPQGPVAIAGWTGTGYIVEGPNSFNYLISGGSSGGAFGYGTGPDGPQLPGGYLGYGVGDSALPDLPFGIPFPPIKVNDPVDWVLWVLGLTKLADKVNLACVSVLAAAVTGYVAEGSTVAFAAMVARVAAVGVLAFYPPAALLAAEIMFHLIILAITLALLDNAANCLFNGLRRGDG